MRRHSYEGKDLVNVRITPDAPSYAECTPDLWYPSFPEVSIDDIALLGVKHVALDCDGTVWSFNGRQPSAPDSHLKKIEELKNDPRVASVSIATECGVPTDRILEDLGLPHGTIVIKMTEAGGYMYGKQSKRFWSRLLFDLDALDSPDEVAIIGDSRVQDIVPAASHGIRTVLVDRLQYPESNRGEGWPY